MYNDFSRKQMWRSRLRKTTYSTDNYFFEIRVFTSSSMVLTLVTEIHFTLRLGASPPMMISVNPSFAASSTRFFSWKTLFARPVRESSPMKIRFLSGIFLLDEMIAAARARSSHGSFRLSPRAIFVYTSDESSDTSPNFEIIAMMRSVFHCEIPRLERFG